MNAVDINLGRVFAQAYESDYAVIRRCLIANAGIGYLAIEKYLRKAVPAQSNTLARLRSVQSLAGETVAEMQFVKPPQIRQCPECARHLYHADIFALPWVTQCPLHHCAITETCPACKQPWPERQQISRRNCPVCGTFSLDQFDNSILKENARQHYQAVANIHELVVRGALDWWVRVPIEAQTFPAFQAKLSPGVAKATLKALHLPVVNIKQISSKLLETNGNRDSAARDEAPAKYIHVSETPSSKKLYSHFKVMRFVVDWIARHTPDTMLSKCQVIGISVYVIGWMRRYPALTVWP